MASYGLLSTGFATKPQSVIRDEINTLIKAARGNSVDLSDGSLLGVLVGILSEREGLLWDLCQVLYAAYDPDAATNDALDAIAALTGTFRTPARSSQVTETLTGTPTTVVAQGSQVKTSSTSQIFTTTTGATITALTAWAATTAYVVGDRRTNASRCYKCVTAGTSAGSGGPTTTSSDITDGTVHWTYLGEGTGAVDVAMSSLDTGAIVAAARDLTVINTPVGGWQSAINLLDADLGNAVESDESLRVRREDELFQPGTTTPDAIRTDLLDLASVVSVTVFYNPGDVTDADGIPPHSVEALVRGGTDQAIVDRLGEQCIAAGIGTHGTTTGTWVDDEGTNHTIKFSRPTLINIYTDVFLEKDAALYPTTGDALVEQAIVRFGDAQKTGKNAVASSIAKACFDVTGVLDVTEVRIYTDAIATATAWAPTTAYVATPGARSVVTNGGRAYICITSGTSAGSGGPLSAGTDITDGTAHWRFLGATVPISLRELAVFDTSRIDMTSSSGTP